MLIGLSFSLRFPEPCLDTRVTLANLEDAGNFDEPIHCVKGVRIQTFIGPCFPGFNYGKITSRKNPYLNTYSHSSCFVNFKACIFSKIISIFLDKTWFVSHDAVRMLISDSTKSSSLSEPPLREKRVVKCHAGKSKIFLEYSLLLFGK